MTAETRVEPGRAAGILSTGTLLTFVRPASWVVALAGFLARGGLVLLTAPILVAPSLSGLATATGPFLERIVLGGPDDAILVTGALAFGVTVAVIVGLLLIGGSVDGWLVATAADELGVGPIPSARLGAARLATARAIAQVPLVLAIVLVVGPIVGATYDELLVPGDLGTPVALRVMAAIPGPIALVLGAAILSDMLGALAVRAVALAGASVPRSIAIAIGTMLRRPLDTLTTLGLSLGIMFVLVVPAWVAASIAFGGLRAVAADAPDSGVFVGSTLLLVGCWLGGLLLAGIGSAWRSFAWTCVHLRAWPSPTGPTQGW